MEGSYSTGQLFLLELLKRQYDVREIHPMISGVKAGEYELIALPIRLENGDAGLTRAIIRPLD
jgi:hypothetical protein